VILPQVFQAEIGEIPIPCQCPLRWVLLSQIYWVCRFGKVVRLMNVMNMKQPMLEEICAEEEMDDGLRQVMKVF
jgi:hypothetical protein